MQLCPMVDVDLIDMKNYNKNVADENLIKVQREKEYVIASARWSYVITIIVLFMVQL